MWKDIAMTLVSSLLTPAQIDQLRNAAAPLNNLAVDQNTIGLGA